MVLQTTNHQFNSVVTTYTETTMCSGIFSYKFHEFRGFHLRNKLWFWKLYREIFDI